MHAGQPIQHPPTPNFNKAPPDRLPAFGLGPNLVEFQTDTGRIRDIVWVDEQDAQRVLAAYQAQGVALPIYKEHRPLDGSYGAMRIELNAQGGLDQLWTLSGAGTELVASGSYMFDSPEILTEFRGDGRRHLIEIRAGSMTNVPARTGSRPLLMSANMTQPQNKELVTSGRSCLGSLGTLEGALKTLISANDPRLKELAESLSPHIGPAVAKLQGVLEELDPTGQISSPTEVGAPAEPMKLTAAASDAMKLGAEVLKMTGAQSSAEALGVMEARQNQVLRLTGKLAELGVETGRLPATEKQKYATYEPARLIALLDNSSPMNLSARHEQEASTDSNGAQSPESQRWASSTQSAVDEVFARHGIKKGS